MKTKFKDAALGSVYYVQKKHPYVILQTYGDGLVASVRDEPLFRQSLCCFVDEEDGISLDTEIEITTPSEMLQRIEALEAALTEAHRVILHELDNGRTPYLLPVDNGGK